LLPVVLIGFLLQLVILLLSEMDSALLNFIENLHNIRSYGEDFHELSDFKTFLASIEEYIDDYENISFIDLLRRKILDIISNVGMRYILNH